MKTYTFTIKQGRKVIMKVNVEAESLLEAEVTLSIDYLSKKMNEGIEDGIYKVSITEK